MEIQSGGRERIGAVRTSDVDFGHKTGKTVERCIESIAHRKLAHRIEDDSFGFSRRLSDFWFAIHVGPQHGEHAPSAGRSRSYRTDDFRIL